MKNPNPEMLLRIAQGDAYAMAVEYVSQTERPELYEEALRFERYLKHPTHSLNAGCYTDDTQMSIAVAEALLLNALGDWDEHLDSDSFSERFWAVHNRDPRDGYSRGFQAILDRAKSPKQMVDMLVPDSNKNGAAMRSVPLGVISDVRPMLDAARVQASVTHDTPGGIASSQAVALMSHFALHTDYGLDKMFDFCVEYLPEFEAFREPWSGGVGLKGTDPRGLGIGMCTAHAVHTLLATKGSLMEILRQVIEWRGDTDSVAAIAWGIASARYGDEALPEFLEWDLEARGNLKYGPTFLRELGAKLMDMFKST